jgi:hypothetical protein
MKKRIIAIIAVAGLTLAAITPALADSNGSNGYEGQPGNQGNGQNGYEGQPGNQGGG